jgi:hypothetical protein
MLAVGDADTTADFTIRDQRQYRSMPRMTAKQTEDISLLMRYQNAVLAKIATGYANIVNGNDAKDSGSLCSEVDSRQLKRWCNTKEYLVKATTKMFKR